MSVSEKILKAEQEFAMTINRYSLENISDTPDFILADLMTQTLGAFGIAMAAPETEQSFVFAIQMQSVFDDVAGSRSQWYKADCEVPK